MWRQYHKIDGKGKRQDLTPIALLTIDVPTRDAKIIRRAAGECLKRVPLDRRIRLLGVRVGALSKPEEAAICADLQRSLLQ